jgi:hypothetical protein
LTFGAGSGLEGEGGTRSAGNQQGAANGSSGSASTGASRALLTKLFQSGDMAAGQTEARNKGAAESSTRLEHGSTEQLTAAEQRLQKSIQRIEAERKRRASAAGVWRNDGPGNTTWKDW